MIVFLFLLCSTICNASLLHLKQSILEQQQENVVPGNDTASEMVSAGFVLLPRKKCCNPYKQPGRYGNVGCSSGAAKCCTNGEWACPRSDGTAICAGISTCGPFMSACEVKCCDPFTRPGSYGNPSCHFEAKCCYDGSWTCANADGTYMCGGSLTSVLGSRCPIKCCRAAEKPSASDCLFGAACCYDGTWSCRAPDATGVWTWQCGGRSTNGPFGNECIPPICCDPKKEPCHFGNPCCFEGHGCCPRTGLWVCGNGDGSLPCSGGSPCAPSLMEAGAQLSAEEPSNAVLLEKEGVAIVTDPVITDTDPDTISPIIRIPILLKQCCNPWKEPGRYGNTACSSGRTAKCCTDGEWACPLADGSVICNGIYTNCGLSSACDVKCCDPYQEPGKNGYPVCQYGAKCCYTGQWACANADGSFTCGGSLTTVATNKACNFKCCPLGGSAPLCLFGTRKCCGNTGAWTCPSTRDGIYHCGTTDTTGPFGIVCPPEIETPIEIPPWDPAGPVITGPVIGPVAPTVAPALIQEKDVPDVSVAALSFLPRPKCCNPWKVPGRYGNPACAGGVAAKCCTNGEWTCPLANGNVICNGIYTCGPFSTICPVQCCDPFREPGRYGNPMCSSGVIAKCCYTGDWVCVNAVGTYTCPVGTGAITTLSAGACGVRCCPIWNRPTCVYGPQCCYDGSWACGNPDGSFVCGGHTTRGPFGSPCPIVLAADTVSADAQPGTQSPALLEEAVPVDSALVVDNGVVDNGADLVVDNGIDASSIIILPRRKCCNPWREPGKYGNSGCSNGLNAKCCTNGEWSCPYYDGSAVCNGIITNCDFMRACPVQCCDPFRQPGRYGNPACSSGVIAKCCYTGDWVCVNAIGTYTCPVGTGAITTLSAGACPVQCCPAYNRPVCVYGPQCCYDGTWACGNPDGSFVCGGHTTRGPFGRQCLIIPTAGPEPTDPALIDDGSVVTASGDGVESVPVSGDGDAGSTEEEEHYNAQ